MDLGRAASFLSNFTKFYIISVDVTKLFFLKNVKIEFTNHHITVRSPVISWNSTLNNNSVYSVVIEKIDFTEFSSNNRERTIPHAELTV